MSIAEIKEIENRIHQAIYRAEQRSTGYNETEKRAVIKQMIDIELESLKLEALLKNEQEDEPTDYSYEDNQNFGMTDYQ